MTAENKELTLEDLKKILLHQNSVLARYEAQLSLFEGMMSQLLWGYTEAATLVAATIKHLIDEDDQEWQKLLAETRKEMIASVKNGAAHAENLAEQFTATNTDIKS